MFLFPIAAQATSVVIDSVKEPTVLDQVVQTSPPLINQKTVQQQSQSETIELTKEQWYQQPELLQQTYYSAALTKNVEALIYLQPIYESVFGEEDFLSRYARALMEHAKGNFAEAVSRYRDLLVSQPDAQIVRVDLAMALHDDRQFIAAKDQLQRLRSEPLPESVIPVVEDTLLAIEKMQEWEFNVSVYYQQNSNINNASKTIKHVFHPLFGVLSFNDPIKAHGIHFDLGASKTLPFDDKWFGSIDLSANGDYWNKKDYNDLRLRAGLGGGYQNAQTKIEFQPYVSNRFYGNRPYSFSFGAQFSQLYWVNNHFQLSGILDISREKFDERKFLEGNRYFASINGVYIVDAKQYWLAGINYYRRKAKDADSAYDRYGVVLGWGQEWPYGISSKVITTAAKSQYDGVDFFNILRKDKDYQAQISLWHRGIHWQGITPKLNYRWSKTDSNHFLHEDEEQQVYIEFSKIF